MARNVTVTFEDGTQHVYRNAPDNLTPEQASERAAQEFGKPVKSLDGGKAAEPLDPRQANEAAQARLKAAEEAWKSSRGSIFSPSSDEFKQAQSELTQAREGASQAHRASKEAKFTEMREAAKTGGLWEKAKYAGGLLGSAVLRGATATPALAAAAGLSEPRPGGTAPSAPLQDSAQLGYKPQTTAERYVAAPLETAVAAVAGPGGFTAPVRNAVIGTSSGLGAEGAASMFGDNAVSRIAGALLGGFTPAVAGRFAPNSQQLLKQATSHIPEQDWRRAKALEQTLSAGDIPHLKSQILGDKSTLADLVAVASTHPSVRPKLMAATENASEQSRKAFELWKNSNLPVAVDETKSVLSDVQSTATGKIASLKGQANAAYTKALPVGVSAATYTPAEVRKLVETLRVVAADPSKFGPLSSGGRFIGSLADDIEGSLQASKILGPNGKPLEVGVKKGYINNLLKDLNTRAEKEGYKGLSMDEVKVAIKGATPEFEAARAAKTTVMQTTVNPAQQGLMGQLAQMGGGVRPDRFTAKEGAINLVFPKDIRQPEAIVKLGKDLGGDGVGELLREHLGRSMERAVKLSTEAGKSQQPFDFVREIAGTNAQRQNLEAALKVTSESLGANPAAVRNGFYKLMRAFESTKDLKLPASVDRAVLQQQAGLNAPGLLVAPQSRLGRVLWERATEKTFNQIADIVMSPDGLKKLEEIAKSTKPAVAEAYARSVLSSAYQANPGQQPAP